MKKIFLTLCLTIFLIFNGHLFANANDSNVYSIDYEQDGQAEYNDFAQPKTKVSKLKIFKDKILYRSYIKKAEKKINKNWSPYDFNGKKKAVASFRIKRNGELDKKSLKIYKSSEDDDFDATILDTIENSSPFKPFEVKLNENFINILMKFNYYSDNPKANDVLGNYTRRIDNIIREKVSFKGYYYAKYLVLKITMGKDGKLLNIEVLHSSGNEKFDRWYVRTVQKCDFPPVPDEVSSGNVVINFLAQKNTKEAFDYEFWYNFKSGLKSLIGR